MKKSAGRDILSFFGNRKYFTLLMAALTTLAVFAVSYGVTSPRRYPLKIGERSKYDIDAPFEMEDAAQGERLAEEAARGAPKVYVRDEAAAAAIIEKTEDFIGDFTLEHNAYRDKVMQSGTGLSQEELHAIIDEAVSELCDRTAAHKVAMSREEAENILTEVSRAELDSFFSEFLAKITDIAENQDITPSNYNEHVASLWRAIQQSSYKNRNLMNVTSLFAVNALSVNMAADEEQTKAERDRLREANLERKIIIPKGKRLLSVDDLVTISSYQLLDSYGLVENGEIDYEKLIKVVFVLLGIAILFYFYLSSVGMELLESNSQVLQLGCVIVVTLTVCRFMYPVHRLAMPIYIAPILIAYLINTRVALVINIYILSVLSLFSGMDVQTMLFFMIGGAISAIMMIDASTRARFILVAFSLSTTCVFLFIALSTDIRNPSNYIEDAAVLFVTCIASAFLSMGFVALMESLFNTATPLRLTELSSGNTHLLRRLSFEAPGTHHHSLMVGYMAETAALAIGANPFIAKTGAYYHDVGKLTAPGYFSENQYGQNPHDLMDPRESCKIIVSHTTAGVELCEKSKLPKHVVSIVREHHGDTLVGYFYNKAVRMYGEEAAQMEDFRYPGPRPTSREAALVMMADSCEAAIRSSEHKDEAKITDWVKKIIRSKIDDGQLESCAINMRDIIKIEQSFIRVLTGFYHTRVSYPDAPQIQAGEQAPATQAEQPQLPGQTERLIAANAQTVQSAQAAQGAAYIAASEQTAQAQVQAGQANITQDKSYANLPVRQ